MIPIETNNRPISILFLLLYYIFVKILERKFYKQELILLLIYVILLAYTILKGFTSYNGDMAGAFKFLITGGFGFITINVCINFFHSFIKYESQDRLVEFLVDKLLKSTILPLIVGFLQFFATFNLISMSLATKITDIFSWRPFEGRIQLLNTEPAHASIYLVSVLFFVWRMKIIKTQLDKIVIFLIFIFILLISSSAGYIVFILTVFFSWLLIERKNAFKIIKNVLFAIFIGVFSYYIIFEMFPVEYTIQRFRQITELLSFDKDLIISLIVIDFSIYDRLCTPILAFLSMKSTNFLGAGGESYFFIYENVIYDFLPEAMENSFLKKALADGQRFTPKLLIAKIGAEFGIIPLILIIIFFIRIFKRIQILRNDSPKNKVFMGLSVNFICALLSSYMASYFNFYFILIITFSYFIIRNNHGKKLERSTR